MKIPYSKKYFSAESSIHGFGLFARRNIKRGEVIFLIKGRPIQWKVVDKATSMVGPNWIGLGDGKWIDPIGPGNLLNHSCSPNAGIKGKVSVTALKPIKKGHEITIDYAITEADLLWSLDCECRHKLCRKKIRSIQSLPKRLIKNYLPYVPHHFHRVYKTTKKP